MTLLPLSEMYKFPAVSMAMPEGKYIPALSAGPPSPEYWLEPRDAFPATVVITLVAASTYEKGGQASGGASVCGVSILQSQGW